MSYTTVLKKQRWPSLFDLNFNIQQKHICDMIKGNKWDVGNIDYELQAKRGDKFLCFTLFLNFTELFISLQPDVRLRWGLDPKCSILNVQVIYNEKSNLNIADMWLISLDHVTYDKDVHLAFGHLSLRPFVAIQKKIIIENPCSMHIWANQGLIKVWWPELTCGLPFENPWCTGVLWDQVYIKGWPCRVFLFDVCSCPIICFQFSLDMTSISMHYTCSTQVCNLIVVYVWSNKVDITYIGDEIMHIYIWGHFQILGETRYR